MKWPIGCNINGMSHPEKRVDHTYPIVSSKDAGLGPGSAGQSGDIQGLSDIASADSESVVELLEEGQFREADVISGVEDAPDADEAEVHTRQVPEDDVPDEYLEADEYPEQE
jgi:hypothetical protein